MLELELRGLLNGYLSSNSSKSRVPKEKISELLVSFRASISMGSNSDLSRLSGADKWPGSQICLLFAQVNLMV